MCSVSSPWQRAAEVSHGLTLVKEHLALMVERLKDCGFDLLAAFAELLAATFALSDALFAATPAAYFWDSSRGLALASSGLSPAAVVPWGMGGLLQGPDCFQAYLVKLAALMAALMGPATCLAALLAARRLAAIPGRLVSACFTGSRWKHLAGQAGEKLLSGWVPCSPWTRVMLQIPQVGRCRATVSLATESSVPVFFCANKEGTITAAHVTDLSKDYITACLPEPNVRGSSFGMRRWQQQEKEPPAFSCF